MASPQSELEPGTFWNAVASQSRRALENGALQPRTTRATYIEDEGIEFIVRITSNLARKQSAPSAYHRAHDPDPFLDPDPRLTVGPLPPDHLAVLNKFNVIDSHALVISRGFIHQETPLTAGDFSAVAIGLQNGDGFAFYNAGRVAGASQPHKHFQLVPLPLGRRVDVPMAVRFRDAGSGLNTVSGLDFEHAFYRLDTDPRDRTAFGQACSEIYATALRDLGLAARENNAFEYLPPYNLLLTRHWMFLVPRRIEHFRNISVNALGYAGSLFVSSEEKLAAVRRTGPMRVLNEVSKPRS